MYHLARLRISVYIKNTKRYTNNNVFDVKYINTAIKNCNSNSLMTNFLCIKMLITCLMVNNLNIKYEYPLFNKCKYLSYNANTFINIISILLFITSILLFVTSIINYFIIFICIIIIIIVNIFINIIFIFIIKFIINIH